MAVCPTVLHTLVWYRTRPQYCIQRCKKGAAYPTLYRTKRRSTPYAGTEKCSNMPDVSTGHCTPLAKGFRYSADGLGKSSSSSGRGYLLHGLECRSEFRVSSRVSSWGVRVPICMLDGIKLSFSEVDVGVVVRSAQLRGARRGEGKRRGGGKREEERREDEE
eukprot:3239586-Rhodomonas_salina.2